jgi:hypothetical protein
MAPRTGDKVDRPDHPVMAPLGTDDEAAGTPPSRDRVKPVQINASKLDAPTRFYFVFIIALALLFIGFGLFAPRP